MKNLLFVLFLCLGLAACNEDSTTEPGNPIKNVELPSSALTAGQPVTIQGEGFVASDQIWLKAVAAKATENTLIQATVTEATTTSIIFTVPATAVGTFEILLQRAGVKHSLGNLTFNAAVQAKYYSFCYDADKMELAEIDINTGNVTWTGLKIPQFGVSGSYVFNEANDELITLGDNGIGSVNWVLNKLNVRTKSVTSLTVTNWNGAEYFDDIIRSNDGKYYAFCSDADKLELAEIDINTGNVTWTGLKIPQFGVSGSYVFNEANDELITLGDNGIGSVNWVLNKLNIETKSVTSLTVTNWNGAEYFDDIIRSNDGKYYAFCSDANKMELVEIDVNTGNLIWTGLKIPQFGISGSYVFNEADDELITLGDNGTNRVNWMLNKLNMRTKSVTSLTVTNRNGAEYFDDIIRL